MTFATSIRFLKNWMRLTFTDATSQTSGWPTFFGATVLGIISSKFGVNVSASPIENVAANVLVCWLLAFIFCMFRALHRARRIGDPIDVKVVDNLRSPDFVFNDKVRGYSVAAIVHNRSVEHLKDCVAYITNAPLADGTIGVRFVEKFDLPPKSKRNVFIAYWFSRQPPSVNDADIGLSGPVAACFGGNVCRVPKGSEVHIKIHVPEAESKTLRCRVWIDDRSSSLRVVPLANLGGQG
jgi:hypothetical protein